MNLIYTSKFAGEYRKLPDEIKAIAKKRIAIFIKAPRDPQLKTHKLRGRLKDFWSFSIDHRYRIIFEFGEEATVYFHSAGDHSIYE